MKDGEEDPIGILMIPGQKEGRFGRTLSGKSKNMRDELQPPSGELPGLKKTKQFKKKPKIKKGRGYFRRKPHG